MTGLEIFLLTLVLGLSTILSVGIWFSARAGRRVRAWEELFTDTFEEMTNSAEIFHSLVHKRELLLDDPDIQRLIKVFDYTLSILERYIIDGNNLSPQAKQEEREE